MNKKKEEGNWRNNQKEHWSFWIHFNAVLFLGEQYLGLTIILYWRTSVYSVFKESPHWFSPIMCSFPNFNQVLQVGCILQKPPRGAAWETLVEWDIHPRGYNLILPVGQSLYTYLCNQIDEDVCRISTASQIPAPLWTRTVNRLNQHRRFLRMQGRDTGNDGQSFLHTMHARNPHRPCTTPTYHPWN